MEAFVYIVTIYLDIKFQNWLMRSSRCHGSVCSQPRKPTVSWVVSKDVWPDLFCLVNKKQKILWWFLLLEFIYFPQFRYIFLERKAEVQQINHEHCKGKGTRQWKRLHRYFRSLLTLFLGSQQLL